MYAFSFNSTNLLRAFSNSVKIIFQAPAFITQLNKLKLCTRFKRTDAYPAEPEDGYGWEKLFSERMQAF